MIGVLWLPWWSAFYIQPNDHAFKVTGSGEMVALNCAGHDADVRSQEIAAPTTVPKYIAITVVEWTHGLGAMPVAVAGWLWGCTPRR